MYEEENKRKPLRAWCLPVSKEHSLQTAWSRSARLGDSNAQTPCLLFSWKLNWIVTLCEHQAAGSKLSYFPAWSGCSSLVPSWSLFNLQFSFILSSIWASQSGFFSPRLSTRFHSLGTMAQSLPMQAIPKLSQVGKSNRTQTLPCLSGTYGMSPLGAEQRQSFHRPVFLSERTGCTFDLFMNAVEALRTAQRKPFTKTVPAWMWFLPCQSLALCLSPRKTWNSDKFVPQLGRLSKSLLSS